MAILEYSTLIALARALEGREILTPTRPKPFRVEVRRDVGLKFVPASGKPRTEYRNRIELVLQRDESTGSTRKSDYNDDSRNASYLLALIRHYRDENPARTTISAVKVAHELQKTIEDSVLLTDAELADRVTQYPTMPASISVVTTMFQRNPFVVRTVLKNANGVCQSCFNDAPFRRQSNGEPYLEVHHRQRLADGGEDTVENAIAVCPNCHRRAHYGAGS